MESLVASTRSRRFCHVLCAQSNGRPGPRAPDAKRAEDEGHRYISKKNKKSIKKK